MTTITAQVIADSVHAGVPRITTMQLRFPRIVLAEFNTHRRFCLGGDARLDFELPCAVDRNERRVHSMTLREFADKWFNGAAEGRSPAHNGIFLDDLEDDRPYDVKEIAERLGYKKTLNLNAMCRAGAISGAEKSYGRWRAMGGAWKSWRASTGQRRFSMRSRLQDMWIRQVDEETGAVSLASVTDCVVSGVKPVFNLKAGDFTTTCTADHRIFTDAGWKRLADIVVGVDRVCTYRYGTGRTEDPYKKIDGRWVSRWNLQVREEVAGRQKNLCYVTGEPLEDGYHIHHLEARHENPDRAFDIENVRAVNPKAHRELHSVQGWQSGVPLGTTFRTVDAVDPLGKMDTYDLSISGQYPNFFADGVVVHNSRNARSSRAVPIATMIREIEEAPFIPLHWGAAQKGMQADEESNENVFWSEEIGDLCMDRKNAWLAARDRAVTIAQGFANAGYHKQLTNRLLEPFMHVDLLVTSTEWQNFFDLRDHRDAEPHIQILAREIKKAMAESAPRVLQNGAWHLPYVSDHELEKHGPLIARKLSTARCARISYAPFDGNATVEAEIVRHDNLVGSQPIHASPAEHQATPDSKNYIRGEWRWEKPHLHRNFSGWKQYRAIIEDVGC